MTKKSNKVSPRSVPSQDDWYMSQAFWVASKSEDPMTQSGAILISENDIVIGTGYNGPPASYDEMDWSRPAKYPHIVPAADKAISQCLLPMLIAGSTLYVTARPSEESMLNIAQHKIKRVVFFPLGVSEKNTEIIKEIAKRGKINLEQFKGNLNWMRDRMLFFEELGIF